MSAATFRRFYDTWFDQLHHLTAHLSALPATANSDENRRRTRTLVDKVMSHYTEYYRMKSLAAAGDVLCLFSAPWASSLERSLHWVAGFRPTTLFHLIYTESSIKFESNVVNILRGHHTGDLGGLSAAQLAGVSDLQCATVKAENDISGRLNDWQDALLGLDWAAMYCGGAGGGDALERRIERLTEVVGAADELRLDTLRKTVDLLTPQQAAEFLVAAAELLFGVRAWGLHQDRIHGVLREDSGAQAIS